MTTPEKPDDKLPIRFEVDARDEQQRSATAPAKPVYTGPRSKFREAWIAEINERVRHDHVDWENQSDKYIRDYLDEIRHARLRLDEIATVKRDDAPNTENARRDKPRSAGLAPLPNSVDAIETDDERALPRAQRPLPAQLRRRKGK